MTPSSRTPDRKQGRVFTRAFAMLAAAAALFLQIFVVQTHTHARTPLGNAGYERVADAHGPGDGPGHAHVSATHEQAGCIVCSVFASSGQSIAPDAATLSAGHNAAYETAALAIRRAPRALTHVWQSRAPPTAL